MLRPNSGPYTAATRLACDDSPRSVDYLVSIRGHSRLYEGLPSKSEAISVNLLNLPRTSFGSVVAGAFPPLSPWQMRSKGST